MALADAQRLLDVSALQIALHVGPKEEPDLLARKSLVDLPHGSLPLVSGRLSGGVHFSALNCPPFNFELQPG